MDSIQNSKGDIWYGMHFYPGLAEYHEPDSDPYRVYLNEDTIRSMDPSFAGRPVFVEHVDDVDADLNELRKEADGWVIESFYNSADGKHWTKFIVVSDKGKRAIQSGMRLSNAYIPKSFKEGGLWNGISYEKEITGGTYEHLAIVKHPRYEESVILSPDEFKMYNETKVLELKKLSNSKGEKMKFSFFKKQKVENTIDIESMSVVLPKTGKEVSITQLINAMDKDMEVKKNESMEEMKVEKEEKSAEVDHNSSLADMMHKVKLHDGSYCNVAELMDRHKAMAEELESIKKKKEDGVEEDLEMQPTEVEVEGDESSMDNQDMEEKESALKLKEPKEPEVEMAKRKNALEKAERLKTAEQRMNGSMMNEANIVETSSDRVARGRALYGSSK